MSNRENLRRIAALSLVIAFGMSGAAGLADEELAVINTSDNNEVDVTDAVAVQSDSSDFIVDGSDNIPANNIPELEYTDSPALVDVLNSIPFEMESYQMSYTLYNPNNVICDDNYSFAVTISRADGGTLEGLSNITAHVESKDFPAIISESSFELSSNKLQASIYISLNILPDFGKDVETSITLSAEFTDGRTADFGNQSINIKYIDNGIEFDTTNIHPEDSGLGGFDWNSTVLPGDTITFPSVKLNYNGNVHTLEFHNNAQNHVFITNSDDFTSITFPWRLWPLWDFC